MIQIFHDFSSELGLFIKIRSHEVEIIFNYFIQFYFSIFSCLFVFYIMNLYSITKVSCSIFPDILVSKFAISFKLSSNTPSKLRLSSWNAFWSSFILKKLKKMKFLYIYLSCTSFVIEFMDLLNAIEDSFNLSWNPFIFNSKELIVPVFDFTRLF